MDTFFSSLAFLFFSGIRTILFYWQEKKIAFPVRDIDVL